MTKAKGLLVSTPKVTHLIAQAPLFDSTKAPSEPEPASHIAKYFTRPFQYNFSPSGELKSFVYSKPDGSYSLELILNKRGEIVAIDPEHKMPKQEVKAIEQSIRTALLDDNGSKVGQTICFLFGTVERYFTCNYFQLLPVPAYAPKPTMGIMHYPFLLQYPYPASSHWLIDGMRRQETEQRYFYLFSLFLHTKITQNPSAFHPGWTVDQTGKLTEERFLGYTFENFSAVFKTFVETWFPDAARDPEALGLLYNTRSTAVHGSGILLSDSHPWIHFTEHKQALDEYDTYRRAYLITKVVLYNWLYMR